MRIYYSTNKFESNILATCSNCGYPVLFGKCNKAITVSDVAYDRAAEMLNDSHTSFCKNCGKTLLNDRHTNPSQIYNVTHMSYDSKGETDEVN